MSRSDRMSPQRVFPPARCQSCCCFLLLPLLLPALLCSVLFCSHCSYCCRCLCRSRCCWRSRWQCDAATAEKACGDFWFRFIREKNRRSLLRMDATERSFREFFFSQILQGECNEMMEPLGKNAITILHSHPPMRCFPGQRFAPVYELCV